MQEDNLNNNQTELENFELENQGAAGFNIGRNQKILIGVLVFFMVFLLIYQFTSFTRNINKPFRLEPADTTANNDSSEAICADGTCNTDTEYLRAIDTDNDGLSDYDELNIYMTSPYLEDSDSDGYADKQEIENDKDPNCPIGRDCSGKQDIPGAIQKVSGDENISPANKENQPGDQSKEKSKQDIEEIKAFLLANGVEQEILDQATDEIILETYDEIFK